MVEASARDERTDLTKNAKDVLAVDSFPLVILAIPLLFRVASHPQAPRALRTPHRAQDAPDGRAVEVGRREENEPHVCRRLEQVQRVVRRRVRLELRCWPGVEEAKGRASGSGGELTGRGGRVVRARELLGHVSQAQHDSIDELCLLVKRQPLLALERRVSVACLEMENVGRDVWEDRSCGSSGEGRPPVPVLVVDDVAVTDCSTSGAIQKQATKMIREADGPGEDVEAEDHRDGRWSSVG